MIGIGRGISRTAFLVGNYAVKVPSFRHGVLYFVFGLLGNLLEYSHWQRSRHPNLAPVYWCAPFGLLLVMRRYRHLLDRLLTEEEKKQLPFINIDDNGRNVAIDTSGRLILFDYGNPGMYLVCERAI